MSNAYIFANGITARTSFGGSQGITGDIRDVGLPRDPGFGGLPAPVQVEPDQINLAKARGAFRERAFAWFAIGEDIGIAHRGEVLTRWRVRPEGGSCGALCTSTRAASARPRARIWGLMPGECQIVSAWPSRRAISRVS